MNEINSLLFKGIRALIQYQYQYQYQNQLYLSNKKLFIDAYKQTIPNYFAV